MTEPQVYLAPNIRQQALETIEARLDERRSRRLLNAIELNQTKLKKLATQVSKDAEKFAKAIEKSSKALDAARDQLEKAEDALRLATSIHNTLTLLEGELK